MLPLLRRERNLRRDWPRPAPNGELACQATFDDIAFVSTHVLTQAVVGARYRAMLESCSWAAPCAEANPEEAA